MKADLSDYAKLQKDLEIKKSCNYLGYAPVQNCANYTEKQKSLQLSFLHLTMAYRGRLYICADHLSLSIFHIRLLSF